MADKQKMEITILPNGEVSIRCCACRAPPASRYGGAGESLGKVKSREKPPSTTRRARDHGNHAEERVLIRLTHLSGACRHRRRCREGGDPHRPREDCDVQFRRPARRAGVDAPRGESDSSGPVRLIDVGSTNGTWSTGSWCARTGCARRQDRLRRAGRAGGPVDVEEASRTSRAMDRSLPLADAGAARTQDYRHRTWTRRRWPARRS